MSAPPPNIPVPDPSRLTTEALARDIGAMQELLTARMDGRDTLNDALFAAARLAADKSEAAATKQIDQIGQILNTRTDGLDGKINDLRERLTNGEGKSAGVGISTAAIFQLILSGSAVAAVIVALFTRH